MERRISTLTLLPALLRGNREAMPKPQPRSVAAALSAAARPSTMLRADVPAELRVLTVPGTLDIVLGHLLDNARRHAGPAATVTVRARAVDATPERWPSGHPITIAGPMVLLSVADDGPGVPPAFWPHLFRPVQRAQPGLGIGLWLSQQLVRIHGGDLVLDDTAPGAAFLSLWPAARAVNANPPAQTAGPTIRTPLAYRCTRSGSARG
jgi:signal transduction histidine kinase